MLNQDLAEEIYARRTLLRISDPVRARAVVAARVGVGLERSAPASTPMERGLRAGQPYERIALVPEPGIRLEVELFHPTSAAGRRPAVIFARADGESTRGVPDAAWAPWREAGHVVVGVRVRGALVQPAKPEPYWSESYRTAMRAILLGKTMLGMRVQDLLSVYDYVRSRSEVEATRVTVVGEGNMGVVALCAAALEPAIRQAVTEKALPSYLEIVRARDYPETLVDLIVPGALLDFDLPDPVLDKERIEADLNRLIGEDRPLAMRWIEDAELAANPDLVRTMSVRPPSEQGRVRVIEVAGADLQPCGGTHVRSTGEVGRVRVGKIEKKGRQNRRINLLFEA